MKPVIRIVDDPPAESPAIACEEDGRLIVYIWAALSEEEREAAKKVALRTHYGRRRRSRRILVLVPAAFVAAVRFVTMRKAEAAVALGVALSAGVVVFARAPFVQRLEPSSPQPGVTSGQPQRSGAAAPRGLHALPGGAVPGSSVSPGTAVQASRSPSPRPSPGQSAAAGGHASPSPSAAPPVIPSPLVSVSVGVTGSPSPSPSPSGVLCVHLLVRLCV